MKKLIPIILIFFAVVLVLFIIPDRATIQELSQVQKDTVAFMGNPDHFVITYIPSGEDSDTLVRSEVWYYLSDRAKVIFLGGELLTIEELVIPDATEEPLAALSTTPLSPTQIHFDTTIKQLEKLANDDSFSQIDIIPELADKKSGTFVSKDFLAVVEQNKTTYFQTLGLEFNEGETE